MPKAKKIVVIFSLVLVFLLALTIYAVQSLSKHYAVPILMYHSVNPLAQKENRLAVTDELFERQMRFLKEHNYNVVKLEDLAGLLKAKKRIPPKTLAITFDDGYKDNFIYAYPILKKYRIPATIFIIIQEVGRVQNDRLSWIEIRQMHDSGLIAFGSHAVGPDPLYKMKSESDLRHQIFDSKKMLEERLGSEVTVFSYPEGMFDRHMQELVQAAGYKMAVATHPGSRFSNEDLFALKRQRISSRSGDGVVFWAQASGYYTFFQGKRHKR